MGNVTISVCLDYLPPACIKDTASVGIFIVPLFLVTGKIYSYEL